MKRVVTLLISLLISTLAFAQSTDTVEYYMNYRGEACSPDSAYYYRLAYKDGNWWKVKDFYLIEKVKKMEGYYTKYAEGKFDNKLGMFFYYHPNGKLESKVRYINNLREGIYKAYNENGLIIDSAIYKNDQLVKNRLKWDNNGNVIFRGMYDTEGNGDGEEQYFFSNGQISEFGKIIQTEFKDSLWTYYHQNGKISCTEFYEYGRCIERRCYDTNGKIEGHCEEMVAPFYDKKRNNMYHIEDGDLLDIAKADYVSFTVKILIDVDGKVLAAEMITNPLVTRVFYKHAIQQLYYMPKWIPGRRFNRPEKMYTNLWVTVVRRR